MARCKRFLLRSFTSGTGNDLPFLLVSYCERYFYSVHHIQVEFVSSMMYRRLIANKWLEILPLRRDISLLDGGKRGDLAFMQMQAEMPTLGYDAIQNEEQVNQTAKVERSNEINCLSVGLTFISHSWYKAKQTTVPGQFLETTSPFTQRSKITSEGLSCSLGLFHPFLDCCLVVSLIV